MSKNDLKLSRFGGAVLFFGLIFALNCAAQTKITGMQAKLFYQNTGTFSADVFSTPSDLWNVWFDYVYSTLVVVEVTGKDDGKTYTNPRKLEFTARYKPFEGSVKEITVKKTSPIWLDENGQANVGFWIDNVGCSPVKISVNIRGQKQRLRKTIKFGCGE
jgi:hypothetical protein